MDRAELDLIVKELGLTQSEIAKLMNRDRRTVNRWFQNPSKMYGPAKALLRAWLQCQRNGLDWGDRIGGRGICASLGLPFIPYSKTTHCEGRR